MLATPTANCAVTNVTYNQKNYYVVTWTIHLESSMYLRRRQWLRQIVVMCHIANGVTDGGKGVSRLPVKLNVKTGLH